MNATRTTQPYKRGQQNPGYALHAMQRGQPFFLQNPADLQRYQQSTLALLLRGTKR